MIITVPVPCNETFLLFCEVHCYNDFLQLCDAGLLMPNVFMVMWRAAYTYACFIYADCVIISTPWCKVYL